MTTAGQDSTDALVSQAPAGLRLWELAGVIAGGLLLTPLLGYGLAWGWRSTRPKAALQALILTLALSVLLGGLWMWLMRQSPA